jgi:hypothetical protein
VSHQLGRELIALPLRRESKAAATRPNGGHTTAGFRVQSRHWPVTVGAALESKGRNNQVIRFKPASTPSPRRPSST